MPRRLEIRLLHYFLLITLASVMIGIEFYFELSDPRLIGDIPALNLGDGAGAVIDLQAGVDQLFSGLRGKIVIMFGVLTVVVAIVLMMFIRNITTPLQKMANAVGKINEGDLSQVIEVETQDEIGQVGQTINGLTSNLQEVAAFGSITCREVLGRLEQVERDVAGGRPPAAGDLAEIRSSLETLQGFVDSFKLL